MQGGGREEGEVERGREEEKRGEREKYYIRCTVNIL